MYNQAEHYYYELIMMGEYSGKQSKQKAIEFLKNAIPEVESFYTETKSPHIKYHLLFLELGFYWTKENYLKSRSICLELLDVVRNNKSVYRRQRVGVVYDHLSRCEYYLGHYKQAVEIAEQAQKHFNLNSENYCIAMEQEFYALFAMKEFEKAEAIANKMISSATKKELGEFRYAKYNFLLANTLFQLHKYNEALNLLSQEMEISKDKTGWEIGLRTLKIMTLVEMGKENEAELAVLALREFFKYTDKKIRERENDAMPISKRDRMILNLLMQAYRKGFMFTSLNGKSEKNISILTNNKEQQWEPFTHEVIPFHEWFAEKMGKKKPATGNKQLAKAKA